MQHPLFAFSAVSFSHILLLILFFALLSDHPAPELFEHHGRVTYPLNTDAGAPAADGTVSRIIVYMAVEIGVRHAAAYV